MSPFLAAQQTFAKLVPALLDYAITAGYGVTLGEAYRTPEQAAWNAQHGKGIAKSLHTQRLAIDLNLYLADGTYCDGSTPETLAPYRTLGRYWTTLGDACVWGGDFSSPDPDHFSLTFGGVK